MENRSSQGGSINHPLVVPRVLSEPFGTFDDLFTCVPSTRNRIEDAGASPTAQRPAVHIHIHGISNGGVA